MSTTIQKLRYYQSSIRTTIGGSTSPDNIHAEELLHRVPSSSLQRRVSVRTIQRRRHDDAKEHARRYSLDDRLVVDGGCSNADHLNLQVDCLVCSFCFRFVGSIEKQIGRKLYFKNLGLSGCCDGDSSGSGEDGSMKYNGKDEQQCGGSSSNHNPLPQEVVSILISFFCLGLFRVPEDVKRPSTVETNDDIFPLAAKVIAFTILRYRKLKEEHVNIQAKQSVSKQSLLLAAWKVYIDCCH